MSFQSENFEIKLLAVNSLLWKIRKSHLIRGLIRLGINFLKDKPPCPTEAMKDSLSTAMKHNTLFQVITN